jgi:hypothetical protein
MTSSVAVPVPRLPSNYTLRCTCSCVVGNLKNNYWWKIIDFTNYNNCKSDTWHQNDINTTVAMTTLLLPWQHYCYHDNTTVTMTTLLLPWQHYCFHDNTIVAMTTLLLPWQHYCYHDNTTVTMTTLLLPWQHYCYHDNTTVTMTTLLLP